MTRDASIVELALWLRSPPGRYLLQWEQQQIDSAVVDVFGFHALQLGLPELDALRANRMPHRWLASDAPHLDWMPAQAACDSNGVAGADAARSCSAAGAGADAPCAVTAPGPTVERGADASSRPTVERGADASSRRMSRVAVQCDFDALPFAGSSLDLVVLPHALELARDPHRALNEVERVLVSEGRTVIIGFNPASLWGLRERFARMRYGTGDNGRPFFVPRVSEFIGYWRLRDWLRLLNFEVEHGRFGCYAPPMETQRWLERFGWMESTGDRWWPVLGAVYFVVAVKRVRGMRLIGLRKDKPKVHAAPAAIATPRTAVRKPAHRREEESAGIDGR